jgi:hypothetical protein
MSLLFVGLVIPVHLLLVIRLTVGFLPCHLKLEVYRRCKSAFLKGEKMFWRKLLVVTGLLCLMVFMATGCNGLTSSATSSTVTATSTSTVGQPSMNGGKFQPPAGNSTMERPGSFNGTMPALPPGDGNFNGQFSDNGTRQGPPGMRGTPQIDLAKTAENLGISEDELKTAVGDLSQGMPDLATIAEKLGVTENALREAIGIPDGTPPQDQPPQGDSQPTATSPATTGIGQ